MAVVALFRVALVGMRTYWLLPFTWTALPALPVVQLGLPTVAAVPPCPEWSATLVPDVSSSFHQPRRLDVTSARATAGASSATATSVALAKKPAECDTDVTARPQF